MTSIPPQLPILLAGFSTADFASWSAERQSTATKTSPFPFPKSPCFYFPVLVHTHCWAPPSAHPSPHSLPPLQLIPHPHAIHQYLSTCIFKGSLSVLSVNNLAVPSQTAWNVTAIPWKTAEFKPGCKCVQISLLLNTTKIKEKPSLLVSGFSTCPSCILQCAPQATVEGAGLAVSSVAISPTCLTVRLLAPSKAWNGIFKGHWRYPKFYTGTLPSPSFYFIKLSGLVTSVWKLCHSFGQQILSSIYNMALKMETWKSQPWPLDGEAAHK